MKVIVTGSRDWGPQHVEIVYRELVAFPKGTIIVHGACRGVDTIAGLVAKALGFVVREYPAEWIKFPKNSKAAGPVRNRYMMITESSVEDEPVDLVLGFHDDIENSKGTKDMCGVAKKFGTPFRLVEK